MKTILSLIFVIIPCAIADVAVLIGGETESPIGSKSVATVSTVSTLCGVFESTLPDLPDKRSMAAATAWKNHMFVCGGYKNIFEGWNTCFMLSLENPDLGWKEIGSMAHGRYNLGLLGIGDSLYAIGGTNGVEQWRSIEVFDMNTKSWTISSTLKLPGFRSDFCTVAIGGNIYLAGGYNEGGEHNELLMLDIKSGEWTQLSPLREDRFRHSCAVQSGMRLIAAGGWYGYGEEFQRDSVEQYNSLTDTWSLLPSMKEQRAQFGLSVGEASLGAFGGHGHDGIVATDTYEIYNAYEGSEWKLGNSSLDQSIFNLAIASVSSDLPIFPEEC